MKNILLIGILIFLPIVLFSQTVLSLDWYIVKEANCKYNQGAMVRFQPKGGTEPYKLTINNKTYLTTLTVEVFVIELSAGNYQCVVEDSSVPKQTIKIPIATTLDKPKLALMVNDSLSCKKKEVTVRVKLNGDWQPDTYDFEWKMINAVDNNDVSFNYNNKDTLRVVIGAGKIKCIVRKSPSECRDTAYLEVYQKKDIPIVKILKDTFLYDCPKKVKIETINPTNNNLAYEWRLESNLINNSLASPQVFDLGYYSVKFTDTKTGCIGYAGTNVIDHPDNPKVDFKIRFITCRTGGDTVHLNMNVTPKSSFGGIYEWFSGDSMIVGPTNMKMVVVNKQGNLHAGYTNPKGCFVFSQGDIIGKASNPPIFTVKDTILNCKRDFILHQGVFNDNGVPMWNSAYTTEATYKWLEKDSIVKKTNLAITNFYTNQPGTYVVKIINPLSGCENTDTFRIKDGSMFSKIKIGVDSVITCKNKEVKLFSNYQSKDYVYQWLFDKKNVGNTTDIQSFDSGIYTLKIIDTKNDCTDSSTIKVQKNIVKPKSPVVTNDYDCSKSEFSLNIVNPSNLNNYEWYNNTTNIGNTEFVKFKAVNSNNILLITTKKDNGCVDSVNLKLQTTTIQANFVVKSPKCLNDKTGELKIINLINAKEPIEINFNNQKSNKKDFVATNLAHGLYPIKIQDANFCVIDTIIKIEKPDSLFIDVENEISINLGDSVSLFPKFSIPINQIKFIQFYEDDKILNCQNCQSINIKPDKSTLVKILLINTNNCKSDVYTKINVNSNVYFPNLFSPNGDNENDVFKMYSGQYVKSVLFFSIYDRWGNLVYQKMQSEVDSAYWDGLIGVSQIPALEGIYTYHVRIELVNNQVKDFNGDFFLIK